MTGPETPSKAASAVSAAWWRGFPYHAANRGSCGLLEGENGLLGGTVYCGGGLGQCRGLLLELLQLCGDDLLLRFSDL